MNRGRISLAKRLLAIFFLVLLCCTQSGCLIYCGFIFALDIAFMGADPNTLPLAACGTQFTYATVTGSSSSGSPTGSNDTFEPMSLPSAPNPNNNVSLPPPLVAAGPATSNPPPAASQTLPPNLPGSLAGVPNSGRESPLKFSPSRGAQ